MNAVTIIHAVEKSDQPDHPTTQVSRPQSPGRKPSPFQGAGASYIMVAAALMGPGIGYLIDHARGTTPFWTIVCFVIFLVAGTYHMIKEGSR